MGKLCNNSGTTIAVLVSTHYYQLPPGACMGAVGSSDADVDGYWINGVFYALSVWPTIGPVQQFIYTDQHPGWPNGTWEGFSDSDDPPDHRGAPNNGYPNQFLSVTCPAWTVDCFPESVFRSNPGDPHHI